MWTVEFAHPDGRGAAAADGEPGWQPDGTYLTPEGERPANDVERAAYLRTVQDWIIRPQLQGRAGRRRHRRDRRLREAVPRPARSADASSPTASRSTTCSRRSSATTSAPAPATSSTTARRTSCARPGASSAPSRSRTIVVGERGGTPIYVRDVGDGRPSARELRTGSATRERRGGRARHGADADRREQPHRVARPSTRRWREVNRDAAARRARDDRCSTARRWSTPRSATVATNLSRARSSSSSCSSCCSATSAPR